jgi:hypothetical protein
VDPAAVAWAHSPVGADAVETWRERPWSEVIRAHAWIRGMGNLLGAESVGLAESPPFWIRRLIAAKREAAAD